MIMEDSPFSVHSKTKSSSSCITIFINHFYYIIYTLLVDCNFIESLDTRIYMAKYRNQIRWRIRFEKEKNTSQEVCHRVSFLEALAHVALTWFPALAFSTSSQHMHDCVTKRTNHTARQKKQNRLIYVQGAMAYLLFAWRNAVWPDQRTIALPVECACSDIENVSSYGTPSFRRTTTQRKLPWCSARMRKRVKSTWLLRDTCSRDSNCFSNVIRSRFIPFFPKFSLLSLSLSF